jgi:chromosome segregation ATPase
MNTVGKMLVVLQLCLSLLFVCFAGATYSLQGQWKDKAEKAEKQIADLNRSNQSSLSEHERELSDAKIAMAEAITERDVLLSRIAAAEERANTADALLAEVRQERDRAIAENLLAADEAEARRTEATAARQQLSSLTSALAAHLEEVRAKENEVVEVTSQLRSYVAAEKRHLSELARLSELLRYHKINPKESIVGEVPELAEKVDGRVIDQLRSTDRTQEFVRVTIGSNDELKENMILAVYREDTYVCDIRVLSVEPNTATAIVLEKTRNSTAVKRGDYVTTQL